MRILMVHAEYRQRGGEESAFDAEIALLRQHGHEVVRHTVQNNELEGKSAVRVASATVWNEAARRVIWEAATDFKANLVHFHNTFPALSPAVFRRPASALPAAVVVTLHNYRFVCAAATLYREGEPCFKCLESAFGLPGVAHRCYRGGALPSALVGFTYGFHRLMGTLTRHVHAYIALSAFAKTIFENAGLPPERIHIKPNVIDPSYQLSFRSQYEHGAVFVGRLSPEKGIVPLIHSWLEHGNGTLTVIGDGPLRPEVERIARSSDRICFLGSIGRSETISHIAGAKCLVFPSLVFEGMPMTILESFSVGVPVIAFQNGVMAEMVEPGVSGLLVPYADFQSLVGAARALIEDDSTRVRLGGGAARAYKDFYSAETNAEILATVYEAAIREAANGLRRGDGRRL